jgi:hypothetical protein
MWDDLPNEIEEVREFELGVVVDLNNLPTNDFARHVEYENVAFSFKTTNAGTVKDLAKEMGLQYTGRRRYCGSGSLNRATFASSRWPTMASRLHSAEQRR